MKKICLGILMSLMVLPSLATAHDHEAAESAAVGPDKGILEADPVSGFRLSPEALRHFEIKTQRLVGTGPWTVPIAARLLSGEEISAYRLRDGHFRRIATQTVRRLNDDWLIRSVDLRAGDAVVISGVAFLRLAELSAFGEGAE